MSNKVFILDSTLRDGAQGQGISFSVEDKLKIVRELDDLGVHYVEAGNPGSNPKDMEFFQKAQALKLQKTKLVAFGSTRRIGVSVQEDKNLQNLLEAKTDVVTIFGKSSGFHVRDILKTTLEENLKLIKESVEYLKANGKEVIFDAEHFFDGYKSDRDYAMETLKAARGAGAEVIVLCDTNGGTTPKEIYDITSEVKNIVGGNIGIHCHNDMGTAVANSILAVDAGANHVQGTFLGIGERCGNANLSSIIPTLMLKMDIDVIEKEQLVNLKSAAMALSEISNILLKDDTPYVGNAAFAHKGGMHIDAVVKEPKSYEHINPEEVGNSRRILVSEVGGKSTILKEVQKLFPNYSKESQEVQTVIDKLKELEHQGYQFEGAEGTVELVIRKIIGKYKPFFTLNSFKVIGEHPSFKANFTSTAFVNINVDGKDEITAAEGDGPVNALDKALRKALEVFYPQLKHIRLVDYKVRVLDEGSATESSVRVLIESSDGSENWTTVGVSRDIIEASWIALVDSIEYKLIKDIERKVRTYF